MTNIALSLFDGGDRNFEGEFASVAISTDQDYVLISLGSNGLRSTSAASGGFIKLRASLVRELAAALSRLTAEEPVPAARALDGTGERP
jgi:hypothetical protein